jgi:hypothetical protein
MERRQQVLFDFLCGNLLISEVPFCDWPIDDAAFLQRATEEIGDVVIGESELTHDHIAFAADHPRKFAGLEVKYRERFLAFAHNPRTFVYRPVETDRLSRSVAKRIHSGEVVCSIPLMDSFFRFSSVRISQDSFSQLLNILRQKPHANFQSALQYALANDVGGDGPVGVLKSRTSGVDLAIARNPIVVFNSLTQNYSFRCCESKVLCYFFSRFSVPAASAAGFLKASLVAFAHNSRPKNWLYFLRLVQLFFRALGDVQLKVVGGLILEVLTAFTLMKSLLAEPAIHPEIGRVLSWSGLFRSPDSRFVGVIDRFVGVSGATSAYFAASAVCAAFSSLRPKLFVPATVADAAQSEVPSLALGALRSAAFLMRTANPAVTEFAHAIGRTFCGCVRPSPLFGEELREAVIVLLTRQPSEVQQLVLPPLSTKCTAGGCEAARVVLREMGTWDDRLSEFLREQTIDAGRQLIEASSRQDRVVDALVALVERFGEFDRDMAVPFYVIRRLANMLEAVPSFLGMVDSEALRVVLTDGDLDAALDLVGNICNE